MKNSLQKGFTLIELLVVIAIIAILSAIVITSLAPAQRKAKVAAFQAEVRSIAPDFVIQCDDGAIALPTVNTNNVDWSTATVDDSGCQVGLGSFTVTGIEAIAFDASDCAASIENGNVTYSGALCE